MKVYFIAIIVAALILDTLCEPYYFGSTNLHCVSNLGKKGKRSAPSRLTWWPVHRFIYYDGWYFEIVEDGRYARNPLGYSRCSWGRESSPAGYSSVSVDCLKRCTDRYTGRYGEYDFFGNNCHHFANRMASILHHYSSGSCPSWC